MDEDEGQQAAEYISQQQMDDYYDRLGEEMERNARMSGCFWGVIIFLAVILVVAGIVYFGG